MGITAPIALVLAGSAGWAGSRIAEVREDERGALIRRGRC